MPLLTRNIEFLPPVKLSPWRKVAMGTWRTVGDPSVYGIVEMDVAPALEYMKKIESKTGSKITLTHFVGKVIANTMAKHPEINCVQRWGRLYPRKNVDIFFQVATDNSGKDLSGLTIRNTDKKSLLEIALEMQAMVQKIRSEGDPDFRKMKNLMGLIPGWASRYLLNISSFLLLGLNVWSPLMGTPRDPFGGCMVTSIGTLGLDIAFAPLVPYSKVPLLLAVGLAKDTPIAKNGQVVITKISKICATFDHRLIDGVHAGKMLKTMTAIFENPERELGPV